MSFLPSPLPSGPSSRRVFREHVSQILHYHQLERIAKLLHYESLMLEAKSRKENSKLEAIEKGVTAKIEEIHSKLGKLGDEKKAMAELNQTLIKNQDMMRRKVKEIEERKTLSLKLKDEQILDLEEQIRDLKVYIGAQKTLDKMNDKDGVKGGTLFPVPLEQSTPARKSKKPSGRRK